MDNKPQQQHVGSEDLPSPGIQAFKDWASKPAKDAPVGRVDRQVPEDAPIGRMDRQVLEDPITAANISEVGYLTPNSTP